MTKTETPQPLRILTAYEKGRHPAWLRRVEILQSLADEFARNKGRQLPGWYCFARQLLWAWRFFRLSSRYDVVLVGSDRVGLLFAAANKLFRRKRAHIVFIDFLISLTPDLSMKRVKRSLYRLAVQGASRVLVQRRCEVQAYSEALQVPSDIFAFVPYHATIYDTPYNSCDGGYVFSGGDGHRDYPLLIEAVRGLPFPVIIAALRRDHFAGLDLPANVHVRSATQTEYVQLMAQARVVVVPLKPMPQHVGGEQTYENAMAMGKATIVTDLDASDYIEDGSTGVLAAAGDVHALRNAIAHLMSDAEAARLMGARAKQAAAAMMMPERFFEDVFRICEECAGGSAIGDTTPPTLASASN